GGTVASLLAERVPETVPLGIGHPLGARDEIEEEPSDGRRLFEWGDIPLPQRRGRLHGPVALRLPVTERTGERVLLFRQCEGRLRKVHPGVALPFGRRSSHGGVRRPAGPAGCRRGHCRLRRVNQAWPCWRTLRDAPEWRASRRSFDLRRRAREGAATC